MIKDAAAKIKATSSRRHRKYELQGTPVTSAHGYVMQGRARARGRAKGGCESRLSPWTKPPRSSQKIGSCRITNGLRSPSGAAPTRQQ